ncbi:hypothetical protein GCM10022215_29750 [Nocardioides fonticola]|uniref:DUF3168 domain-containing protein n=1 Tax=Nocardioides fonticola TaxID=450363 RepID=A0ABP7XPC8_9ACTN
MSRPSEADVATAVIAAFTAANARPFDIDDIPDGAARPKAYTEVMVTRKYSGDAPRRLGVAVTDSTAFRVTTRAVADTIDGAREARRRVATCEGIPISVIGISGVLRFESEDAIGPDDDWFSGLTTWTFVL